MGSAGCHGASDEPSGQAGGKRRGGQAFPPHRGDTELVRERGGWASQDASRSALTV